MRVVQIEGSFGLNNLVMSRRQRPGVAGPTDVLVRMRAASLNARDVLTARGIYNPKQKLPLIPCSDGVGIVESIGVQVSRFQQGERVTPTFAQGWTDGPLTSEFRKITLGGPLDGTLAEFMILSEEGLVRAPEHLTDIEAATLPCAGLTAWNAVIEQGQLKADDTVVVQGTGGVALFALQFARLAGAQTIVLSKDDAKLNSCVELGADHVINYRATPEWSKAVKDATNGVGADLVIELGGEKTLEQSVRAVKPAGTIALIGVLSGSVARLALPLVVMRNVRLQGVTVGNRTQHRRMADRIAHSRLRPVIDSVFELENAKEAFERIDSGDHFGKVCVRHTV